MDCNPLDQDVACTALVMSTSSAGAAMQEVTNSAQWSATPGNVAQLIAPGRFRPMRAGEISIDARSSDGGLRSLLPARFVVAPGAPARRLGTLMVIVRDAGGPLNGALVEVLEGYRAGASCSTAVVGACTIESVATSETFAVRATKTGYQTATTTFRGSPEGRLPPAVLITLTPQ